MRSIYYTSLAAILNSRVVGSNCNGGGGGGKGDVGAFLLLFYCAIYVEMHGISVTASISARVLLLLSELTKSDLYLIYKRERKATVCGSDTYRG